MVFYFVDFYRIVVKVSLVVVGNICLKDIMGFFVDNIFCFNVIKNLFCLFLLERRVFSFEVFYVMLFFYKFFVIGEFEFLLLEYLQFFCNDLKEQWLIFIRLLIVFDLLFDVVVRFLDIDVLCILLFVFNQVIEKLVMFCDCVREEFIKIGLIWLDFRNCLWLLIEELWVCVKLFEDDCDVDYEVLVRIYDIIGKFFYLINEYDEVIKLYQYVIKVRRENIGDYRDILISFISIGSVYFEMGNGMEGEKLF